MVLAWCWPWEARSWSELGTSLLEGRELPPRRAQVYCLMSSIGHTNTSWMNMCANLPACMYAYEYVKIHGGWPRSLLLIYDGPEYKDPICFYKKDPRIPDNCKNLQYNRYPNTGTRISSFVGTPRYIRTYRRGCSVPVVGTAVRDQPRAGCGVPILAHFGKRRCVAVRL